MDPATAAVMILLSYNTIEPFVCKPIDTPRAVYSSLEIICRCRRIDATVTGSLPTGYSKVVVTRGIGINGVSSGYIVPHKD
jgi:hypothetical protein